MPTLKAIYIAKSHNADNTSQNLSISMSFANAPKEMKIVANLKEKYMKMNEYQCLMSRTTLFPTSKRNKRRFLFSYIFKHMENENGI